MPNFRLIPHNLHDDATLSATGTSVAGFGPANTQNTLREEVLRITGTDYVLRGVLPGTRGASGLGIFRHTIAAGGTVQLELFSDAAWSSSVYDSGALDIECFTDDSPGFDFGLRAAFARSNLPFVHYFPAVDFRSYEITFDDITSPDICRVFLGEAWEASVNPDYDAPLSFDDLTEGNRTLGGSHRTNQGEQFAVWRVNFSFLQHDDRQFIVDFMRRNGLARDFMASLFPEDGTLLEATYTGNFKLRNLGPMGWQISRLTKSFEMQEQ
jgi:hypothetical protein